MEAAEYEKKIEECRSSGMTIKAYCDANGIPYNTFNTWVKQSRKRKGLESDKKSYSEYRQLVIEAKKSDKTAKEWCFERGINYKTFCGWSKKVNRKEGRENIDRECGIIRQPYVRRAEPKITPEPVLCEVRR